MRRWRFIDPVDSSEAIFRINPHDGGTPANERTITSVNTLVPGGRTINFEGDLLPDQITFSGVITDQYQLNLYTTWFDKLHQVVLIDDLGRSFFVMMSAFNPKRVRQGRNYWRHSFDATLIVVDWAGV